MKTIILNKLAIVVFLGSLSGGAFASGFTCESVSSRDALNVRLFNHINPQDGTRTPAVLVVSQTGQGTLLVRRNGEISKTIRANTVQYTASGTARLGAMGVILQIAFREGREVLEAGESVDGQLILVQDDGFKSVHALNCRRYLKGDDQQ